MGGDGVRVTKCEISQWNEKCHCASDIPFECCDGSFIVIYLYINRK